MSGENGHAIKRMNVAELTAAPYNPRKISDKALAGLAASIDRFGMVQPVVYNTRTKHIVGGHQRVKALQARGETETDVILVDLPESEERALNVALNNPHISGEFTDDLQEILDGIKLDDEALFKELNLDELWNEPPAEVTEDDVPEVPEEATTKPGDLWVLGEHRLLCGDSTSSADVERVMGGASVDCIITDPPYGMGLDTDFSGIRGTERQRREGKNKLGNTYPSIQGDDREFDPLPVMNLAGDPVEQFWFGADYYAERIPCRVDGSWLVWDKRLTESLDKAIGSCFELIWSKRKHKREMLRFKWSGVFGTEHETAGPRKHPTQKPVPLMADLVGRTTGSAFDPFAGSGTTLIAAEQLGRRCYAIEIEPKYCDVIVQRWEQLTGGKAVLDGG